MTYTTKYANNIEREAKQNNIKKIILQIKKQKQKKKKIKQQKKKIKREEHTKDNKRSTEIV